MSPGAWLVRMRDSPCCGLPHIVACFDGDGELGLNEVVHGKRRVGAGLELTAIRRAVLIVLLEPVIEVAEVALVRVQAGARRGAVFGGWRLQGHHVRVGHDAVGAAVILDGAWARARARARANGCRAGSANTGDQEREEEHQRVALVQG